MNWYLKCLRQYADFSGRARRKELWMFALFNGIFAIGLFFLGAIIGALISGGDENITIIGIALYALVLYLLAVFIPSLAVLVRRLHDVGKSGWWYFIVFIPIIGAIWLFVLLVTDSEAVTNKYGENPKKTSDDYFDPKNGDNENINNLNSDKEMNNSTQPENSSKTVYSESFAGRFGTKIEREEKISSKENPENLKVLCGMLVSFSKTEIGEYWELREGNNSIGSSSSENTIVLSEKHVSSKHAIINVSKDNQNNCWKFQLVDLSSTNGTELNGSKLPIYLRSEIKNGDKIKIGGYVFLFLIVDKFVNQLSKNNKFQEATHYRDYDSRHYFRF